MQLSGILVCTLCFIVCSSLVDSAAIHAPLDVISFDDLSTKERSYLESFAEQVRNRRSGSPDFITPIKSKITSGLKSKLGLIAQGSAAAVSHFSKGSISSGHYSPPHHDYHDIPHGHEEKALDFWALKKGILNTLLQAAKAIKGGVLAIKGQLIKGGGQLISAKGRLISHKGELITSLGKQIAKQAALSPHKHHEEAHHHHHIETPVYGPPSGHAEYGVPSGPSAEYGPALHASPPHNEYLPQKYHSSSYEAKHKAPLGAHAAGIIILKKIPSGHGHQESHIPDFKPLDTSSSHSFLPGLKDIVGSVFSASAGLAASASSTAAHASSAAFSAGSSAAIASVAASSSGKGHGSSHHEEEEPLHDHGSIGGYNYDAPKEQFSDSFGLHSHTSNTASNSPTEPTPIFMLPLEQNNNKSPNIPSTSYGVPLIPNHNGGLDAHNLFDGTDDVGSFQMFNLGSANHFGQTQNAQDQPQLFIGMNLPLDNHDFSNVDSTSNFNNPLQYDFTNFNHDIVANLSNQLLLSNQHASVSNTHELQSPSNQKPSYLDPRHAPKKFSKREPFFLPTPTTNVKPPSHMYNPSESFKSDTILAPSVSHQSKRTAGPKKPKRPSFDVVRSVTYELGPNGPVKLD